MLALEAAATNLEAWVNRHGPMAEPAVRELARQRLEGLHTIHCRDIVLLDLHPGNVLVQAAPIGACSARFKIADFGHQRSAARGG